MTRIELLDHGYVDLVETWGSDERIVEAARMSTGKGFNGWGPKCRTCGDGFDAPERRCPNPNTTGREFVDSGRGGHVFDAQGDEKLLAFLWHNNHATPFEMAGLVIEVKAPILVFREWHRHRTQSYNEMSARYVALPDENYVPSMERMLAGGQAATNKQSSGAAVEQPNALEWLAELAGVYQHAQRVYESGIRRGIARELARLPVPVARYSRMRASANLRNWLAFLTLRQAQNAQWEIRQYADAVCSLIAAAFPRTHALYSNTPTTA